MALASLRQLTYWYPRAVEPALRQVSVALDGGLTVVAGPSGGGKSTFLRVFNGLVPHFHGGRISGSATVAGCDVVTTPTRTLARSVGFVFQDPELQTVYASVDREVAFGLENAAVPASAMRVRVDEALYAAGIEHLAGRQVRTLSGGERQRVAVAGALAMSPRLLVLDEPTSQLDPQGASLVVDALRRTVGGGVAVIISEHRTDRLLTITDRTLRLDAGRLEETAAADGKSGAAIQALRRGSPAGRLAWSVSKGEAGFGRDAVLGSVDLAGAAGEVIALMGPNGGGKTTLLRLIAGLLAPLGGRVERRPGRIAYLPQNPTALLHRPTLRQEVQFTIDHAGESEKPERILDMFGLGAAADRYPRDLSTGERQRAALAVVLAGAPQLVLLDEPTRGMDVASRDALIRVVAGLRDRGAAVVIATHDADLRCALADRVVMVGHGTAAELQTDSVPG